PPGRRRSDPGMAGRARLGRRLRTASRGSGRRCRARAHRTGAGGRVSFGFANPWALLLLPLLLALAWYGRRVWRRPALTFSRAETVAGMGGKLANTLARLPDALRFLVIALPAVALAGPRTCVSSFGVEAEGIAIVIAIDVASSILA